MSLRWQLQVSTRYWRTSCQDSCKKIDQLVVKDLNIPVDSSKLVDAIKEIKSISSWEGTWPNYSERDSVCWHSPDKPAVQHAQEPEYMIYPMWSFSSRRSFRCIAHLAAGMLTIAVAPLGVFHSRLTTLLVSLLDSLMDQDSSLYDIIHVIIRL